MNKNLSWIEQPQNDLDTWKQYYSLFSFSSKMGGTLENPSYFLILKIPKIP
jgi:hypothetical protein